MSLEAAILGFLGESPRSGYDLKTRCFDDAVKDLWTADQAQIYRTLERLRTAKLVASTRKRQSGKPDRKVYSLTDSGQQSLSAWLGSDLPLPSPREPFLLQLFFSAEEPDARIAERLAYQRQLHQAHLDALREHALTAVQEDSGSARQLAVRDMAFGGAIATERALIDWLDDCLEAISAGTLPAETESVGQNPLFGPTTA